MKAETKIRIGEMIEEARKDGVTMGAAIAIWQKGTEIYSGEWGYADAEQKKKIARDTIYRLYSMSKPITATAAMILLERGVIDLAQPVSDFLPGFEELFTIENGAYVKVNTPMTLLHLLNMTSGLTYGGNDSQAGRMTLDYIEECVKRLHGANPVTTEEFANHLGRLPLEFAPDSSWRYGLSADVMGAVIEKASGMRFSEFLQTNLFDPLGMKDTGFWVPKEKQHRLAKAYGTVEKGKMELYTGDNLNVSNQMEVPPVFESGGAGLCSTLDDYGRFGRMLLQGGTLDGVRILSEKTVKFFTSGELTPVQQQAMRSWIGLEGHTYSHFLRILNNPGQASTIGCAGEYGWDGWLGCYFANIPEKDMTIVMMQQKRESGTIPVTRKLRNVILTEA